MKQIKIKLFLVTLCTIIITNHVAIATTAHFPIHNNRIMEQRTGEIVAKKRGGRSGGGFFKRKPSRSRSSSPRRSSTKSRRKSYSSPSRSYQRRTSSPNYGYSNSGNSAVGDFLFFIICFIILGGIIIALCTVIYRALGSLFSGLKPSNRAKRKVAKERDNDRVTISLVQVVLSSEAPEIQQDLSNLATGADTNSDAGLVKLMKEAALILMRNEIYWTHVASSSRSMDISNAESEFDLLSFTERSKFSGESLSNVDGKLITKKSHQTDSDGFPAYVVVTLILGSAEDLSLFESINNVEELQQILRKISAMRDDYLIRFELLWTPQTVNEYLTDEELLMEYTEVIPL